MSMIVVSSSRNPRSGDEVHIVSVCCRFTRIPRPGRGSVSWIREFPKLASILRNMRVALFVTCLVDQFRPTAAEATVKILEDAGCTVDYDREQTCCSQPAFNAGLHPEATPVCRRTIERLDAQLDAGCEAVVAPSGSCVAMFRHAVEMLHQAGDAAGAEAAARVAGSSMELSAFLVRRLEIEDVGATWHGRVA